MPAGGDPKQGGCQACGCGMYHANIRSPRSASEESLRRLVARQENVQIHANFAELPHPLGGHPMTVSPRPPTGGTRPIFAGASLATAAAGLLLASNHPLWPGVISAAFCAWFFASYRHPGLWLAVLPAALPLLNFSPWTGWLVFDEFDLLIMGAVAAEFAHVALQPIAVFSTTPALRRPNMQAVIVIGLTCVGVLGLARGLGTSEGWSLSLFQTYDEPLNSVRIFKPLLHTMLLLPLLQRAFRDIHSTRLAIARIGSGMLLGLSVVTLAVLWDRAAHPGLLDFTIPYRTVALFWEMHVGGAALDAYLALATPFVAWGLVASRTPLQWSMVAVLALLTEYACLTTFSRGVYLAVICPLVLLGLLLWRQRRVRVRATIGARTKAIAALLLAALMLLEAALVLGSGNFMMNRIGASERDLRSRLVHWQNGLNLLRTPSHWAFGIGLGRLPSSYAAMAPGGEFSGRTELAGEPGHQAVRIFGPPTLASLGGLYGLTQRVPLRASETLTVKLDFRAAHATHLRLSVCEMHLLYERNCKTTHVSVQATGSAWQTMSAPLVGPPLTVGRWYAPRMGVFSMTVLGAGSATELDNVSLRGADRAEQLRNGEFGQQLAHWLPIAKNHFLPWHIDNLYLEVLIERGLAGLLVFFILIGFAVWSLCFGPGRGLTIAPFLLASLAGAMTVGLVSSIMDVPRVAFLLLLLALFSIQPNAETKVSA